MMDIEMRVANLEENLRSVTDSNKELDRLVQSLRGGGTGEPVVMAFRCTHSGLYFPGYYVKEWGRKTGIGLGPSPLSECFDSLYEAGLPNLDHIRRADQIMYPLQVSNAQVDWCVVPQSVYEANRLICAHEDPEVEERADIVREKQMVNPRSMLRVLLADFRKG